MKNLPIGRQSFENIRNKENNFIYIDKTKYIYDLIKQNAPYFLSRPRRFGKSLLIDTIRCLFEGKKTLFEGLYIYNKWNFEEKYPVIKIIFGDEFINSTNILQKVLENNIRLACETNEIDYKELSKIETTSGLKLKELIKLLFQKTGKQVVVLVDEYDKPILDMIKNIDIALQIKDEIKGFYSVLKGADEYLKFVMLTGVTKFSKVSVFSGLNNLSDITINEDYNGICGYKYDEIINNFGPEGYLEGVDLEQMKLWYNGYSFGRLDETLYNPFGLLNFFANKNKYNNYWFQTATPTFLIELMKKYKYEFNLAELENMEVGNEILDSFEIEKIELKTLLFQSGYLTIKEITNLGGEIVYKLGVPNEEVRKSLNNYLIKDYLNFKDSSFNFDKLKRLYKTLGNGDLEGYREIIEEIFAGMPYTSPQPSPLEESENNVNDISKYEGYYSSVIYSFMAFTGIEFIAEDHTNRGRIDFTMKLEGNIYIIELKVEKKGLKAMEQIKAKKYYEKYLQENKKIYLVGMEFDKEIKNLGSFEWEKVS